jgi:hypothetical protein
MKPLQQHNWEGSRHAARSQTFSGDSDMEWLNIYRECVKRLEARSYTAADDRDLDCDIAARGTVQEEWSSLSAAEREEVYQLDERFRHALHAALHAADLVEWYRRNAAYYDATDWWWHVEEGK